jgi:hypothetical protein
MDHSMKQSDLMDQVNQLDDSKLYQYGMIFGHGKWFKDNIPSLINLSKQEERALIWGNINEFNYDVADDAGAE